MLSYRGRIDGFLSGLYHLLIVAACTCVFCGRLADRIIAGRVKPERRTCWKN